MSQNKEIPHLAFHEFFMKRALKLAFRAFKEGEVPVGALICRFQKDKRAQQDKKGNFQKKKKGVQNSLKGPFKAKSSFNQNQDLSSEKDIEFFHFQNVEIIAEAYNECERFQSASFHAELLALQRASKKLKQSRLNDCFLYVTLEPCFMCAGAISLSRIQKLVFGALDSKFGAVGSLYNIFENSKLNHKPQIIQGVLSAQCSRVMKDFFKLKRERNKAKRKEGKSLELS